MYSVVIIDDNKIAVEAIRVSTNWEKYDCQVAGTAYDGVAGLELIHRVKPDVVIVDIQMPGFNGLDIIKKLKRENSAIQFIIISGYAQFEYAQRAVRYGVSDYLLKPIMMEEMEAALDKAVCAIQGEAAVIASKEMDKLEEKLHMVKARRKEYSPMIKKALEYVETHIYKQITLTELCGELMVSNAYFSKCFKKETGIGFTNYVAMMKMANARLLLENPRNRVNEVASMLGYNDYAYFFQVFKKYFGYAPSDIRQRGKQDEAQEDTTNG